MLKLFYWTGVSNFGDLLNPLLFERIFSKPVTYAPPHQADAIALGSLLQTLCPPKNCSLRHLVKFKIRAALRAREEPIHIWGTGVLHDNIRLTTSRKMRIHALRGERTKHLFSPEKPMALGDPGILADRLLEGPVQKSYRVGILPHFSDKSSRYLSWLEDNIKGAFVIDVGREPMYVLRKIQQCDLILSSSLHGLVVADSLGIPNRWVMFEDTLRAEERWKYHDYYSVYPGLPLQNPFMITENSLAQLQQECGLGWAHERPGLEDVKQRMLHSFPF